MKKWLPYLAVALLASIFTVSIQVAIQPSSHKDIYKVDQASKINENGSFVGFKGRAVPESFVDIAAEVTSAVVNIKSSASSKDRGSTGSGVIISPDGYIVTCFHVIENAGRVVVGFENKEEKIAKVIGVDPTTDLALLKVDVEGLEVLTPGNSEEVQIGEWVLAVGNPFNLSSTITAGIVSAKGRNINLINDRFGIEAFIQTDAAVNPGNSGGALVNARGELIGVNSAIMSETGRYEGYSFAVPVNLVMKVISDLRDYGSVQRAVLGIGIREINASLAEDLDLATLKGVLITEVYPNSSAEDAGLMSGDVIVGINKEEVISISHLQERLAILRPGDKVDLVYFRGDKKMNTKEVKLKKLVQ